MLVAVVAAALLLETVISISVLVLITVTVDIVDVIAAVVDGL